VTPQRLVIGVVAIVAAILPYLGILPAWTPALATVTAFMALSLIGLNLIFGVTGMLALGQAAFVALPGYASGILEQYGVPSLLAILLGILAAIAIARLVAEIFVRLPGIYFAIGTLGFSFVVEGLARAFPSVTGGASGLVLELPIRLGRLGWYVLAVAALALGVCTFAWLVRGRFLRTLTLVRHDELAAQVLGVNVARVKAQVFTIGSAYSAVGGILLAYYVRVLAPESGGVNASLEALAMVVIGGSGSVFGPLIGSAAIQWLFAASGGAERFELLVYGVGFFLVVLYAPAGIVGALRRGWALLLERRTEMPAAVTPPSVLAPVQHADAVPGSPPRKGVCLQVDNVAKNFGGLRAVQDVSFEVRFGEIVALIGPNGAGKSTLFNVVSGIESPSNGRILLEGADLADVPIHRRAVAIGRSFQVPRLVPQLTPTGNVVARLDHMPGAPGEAAAQRIARQQLAAFGLAEFADMPVSRIGLGHHKLIELVRAAIGEPPLLLLDEPAVGLTPEEVQRLAELLRLLKRDGAAILVVEHNVGFVATVADEVVVMDSGRLIARGTPQAVMADPKVKEAYLGALE
jgi:ABC-type branched-subunit amino acid transport system ATPase component/ABC-type branched-subunit amino acid transport system permease subunit